MSTKLTKAQQSIAEVEEWANPAIWDEGDVEERREWLGLLSALDDELKSLDADALQDEKVYEYATKFVAFRQDIAHEEGRHHDVKSLAALLNRMFDIHYGRKFGQAA